VRDQLDRGVPLMPGEIDKTREELVIGQRCGGQRDACSYSYLRLACA
jgi:hypothetical protein